MSFDPTGVQIHLSLERDGHSVTADITQVGAALRGLTVDGVDLIARFPEGIPAPGASGVVLVPWPNRVRDGRWSHDGVEEQLAITEVARGNASHGLLRFTAYSISETDGAVTLRANVVPQTGFPFLLETSVTYALTTDGVVVTHWIRNASATPAPVAIGVHPYLTVGDAPADELTLRSDAAEEILVDDRLLPVETVPVTDEHDLRAGRVVADLELDTAYTGLTRDAEGEAAHHLSDADGNTTTLWQDENFGWVQFFTHRSYPGHDVAVAVEPMTAPADALNSGDGLIWIEPEDTLTATWGIRFTPAN